MNSQTSPSARGTLPVASIAERIAVLVIGAGQAGLAIGSWFKTRGVPFTIVEAHERIGMSWRRRYASLTLFTPRRFSGLPGIEMSGSPEGYATSGEFADYLERYARAFALPIATGTRVERLTQAEDGTFAAALASGRTVRAQVVVVATGGFQVPVNPDLGKDFDPSVVQLTPGTYRQPSDLPSGTALVVGDGASGRDIAIELAATRRVLLATGKPRRLLPERILGRNVWWWLDKLGLMRASSESPIGRMMRRADPFPDRGRSLTRLKQRGVEVVPRLVAAAGRTARFAHGQAEEIAAVVWATGYRDDTDWIDIPGAVDADGRFSHVAGVSPVPGLFFVGRPWQRNRVSALIMGVGADAALIADAVMEHLRQRPETARLPNPADASSDGCAPIA